MAGSKGRSLAPGWDIAASLNQRLVKGGNWKRLGPLPSVPVYAVLVRSLLLAFVTLQILSICLFLGEVPCALCPWPHPRAAASAAVAVEAASTVHDQPASFEAFLRRSYRLGGTCDLGKRIYVYDLPAQFNAALIANCSTIFPWASFCSPLSNAGLGPSTGESILPWLQQLRRPRPVNLSQPLPVAEADVLELSRAWHNTDQFTGEVLFHSRILEHPCRTQEPHRASAFYVPYYAGLDVSRNLWTAVGTAVRDELATGLLRWLEQQVFFQRNNGRDHFLMVGRITWDFRRSTEDGWGSSFFNMPEAGNMTRLVIERSPWDEQEMGVPYPTSFHPRRERDLKTWQRLVRASQRRTLFSFAGVPRSQFPNDFRANLLDQCHLSKSCRSLRCDKGQCGTGNEFMSLFLDSTFCLQPRGDSFTRRSIFDSLIAGCIPVLFWRQSAYQQYLWHLPEDNSSYSVFISKDDVRAGTVIEDVLRKVSPRKVKEMQRTIINLIPHILYAGAGNELHPVKDAFDVAISGVMKKIQSLGLSYGESLETRRATGTGAPLQEVLAGPFSLLAHKQ